MTKKTEIRRLSVLGWILFLNLSLFGSGGGTPSETPDTTSNSTEVNASRVDATPLFKPVLEEDLGFRINPERFKVASWDTVDLNIYKVNMSVFPGTLSFVIHDPANGVIFTMPTISRVTSGFGARMLWGKHFHYGVDLDLETGDPVFAALDGIIRIARYNSGYGNMVVIAHKGGLETLYGHMSKLNVKEGQRIKSGEVIGLGGSTGHSTGSHLHFEFRVFGEQINPSQVFSFQEAQVEKKIIQVDASWFSYQNNLDIEYHTVLEGEDLETIATIYGVSVSEICDLNRISMKSTITPGFRLRYH